MTEAVTAINTGIVAYLEGLHALADAFKDTVACGNSNIDRTMEHIMEGSYRSTVQHMILCETINKLGVGISDNGRLRYIKDHCQFTLKPDTLEWAFVKSGGIQIDVNKIENDIISETRAAHALNALAVLNRDTRVDMLKLVEANVEFIVALFESGKAKVDEVNAQVHTQLEEAA